jgi:methylated-DNA-[protein]-cysteine S-methyltransferase
MLSQGFRSVAVISQNGIVTAVYLGTDPSRLLKEISRDHPAIARRDEPEVVREFRSYLEGKTRKIELKYQAPEVTPFQSRILAETAKIPYGKTISYSELAKRAGKPKTSRACGAALSSNPLPLIIPCHRVIRADGSSGGFMGDAADKSGWKEFLLNLERSVLELSS